VKDTQNKKHSKYILGSLANLMYSGSPKVIVPDNWAIELKKSKWYKLYCKKSEKEQEND
jgi:hypothetical protein